MGKDIQTLLVAESALFAGRGFSQEQYLQKPALPLLSGQGDGGEWSVRTTRLRPVVRHRLHNLHLLLLHAALRPSTRCLVVAPRLLRLLLCYIPQFHTGRTRRTNKSGTRLRQTLYSCVQSEQCLLATGASERREKRGR